MGKVINKKKRESTVESYFRKQAIAHDYLCYKFVSPANDGVPDRVLVGKGKTLFVELKAPGEKTRKLQEGVIERMRNHGALVFVIDSKDKVDELFNEILV